MMKLYRPNPTLCQCAECGCLGFDYMIDLTIFGVRITWGKKWHCYDLEIDKDVRDTTAYHICDSFVPADECPEGDEY